MDLFNFWGFTPKKVVWVIGIFFITGTIIMILQFVYSYYVPNKKFYETELYGTVQEIYTAPRSNSYRIEDYWYMIKGDCIDYINIGDSIAKDKHSYYFTIFDIKTNSIKYYEEIKVQITLLEVGNEEIPKIPWRER